MILAVALEFRLKRLGLYARAVTLKLTFPNMKSITRSTSSRSGEASEASEAGEAGRVGRLGRVGEPTNEAYEIFMAAFRPLKSVNNSGNGNKSGNTLGNKSGGFIRLIGISLQNLTQYESRQLTFWDLDGLNGLNGSGGFDGFDKKSLKERWDRALRGLEQKYGIQLNDWERRERLYEIIGAMQEQSLMVK